MILILVICLLVAIIYLIIKNNVVFDFSSFFHKGVYRPRGYYGLYCFDGVQGSGKTYAVTKFIINNLPANKKIYANYTLKGVRYTKINNLKELISIQDKDCIIFYDEIFTEITKNTRLQTDVLGFLAQMRKRNNVFLTTAQYWLELPVTWRRFVRFRINCKILSFIGLNIFIEEYEDAEQIKWSTLENDFVCPRIKTKISKLEKRFCDRYDTYEIINPNKNNNFNVKVSC